MNKEIEIDQKRLEGNPEFPLNKSILMTEVLDTVFKLSESPEVLVYWHYLKVLTTVLGECPPDLADLLSQMASSLGPAVLAAS